MKVQHHLYRPTSRRAPRLRYRIPTHEEAGSFESMTSAIVWALKNVSGWDWHVEPFHDESIL